MPTRETTFCSNNENSYSYNQVQYRNSNESFSKVRRRALRRWKDECYKFAQETTLHGLKYITLKDAFTVRRLFWFSLTCTCLSIMSYQIIDRIIYYHSSPITVNVKVNYNRSLVFPSVTVCNQNAFKSSTASDNNWYQLIEAMYNVSANSFNTSALSAFNATDLKLSDIFLNAGHKKEDLIAGCTWEGITCSHDDFQPILTDHGLCYTFKPRNIHNELMVSSSGSDHGLKLFLNVEQYEYMPGPNDAAGIKLLTYNQSDIPRVKELGISIPTGIHVFVGLQLLMIKNLHVPYGECQSMKLKHSTEYSTDACLIECLNDFFQKECGCRNYFIPSTVGSAEECSLEKYYSCYRRYYEQGGTQKNG